MRIAIGVDHAGYTLKAEIVDLIRERGEEILDFGTDSTESVDYPDYACKVARAVAAGEADLGILICATGTGMAIAANKVPGVRAAVCHDSYTGRIAREHNDANVLAFGARVIGPAVAREVVMVWLTASFLGGRHARRLGKIKAMESVPCEKGR